MKYPINEETVRPYRLWNPKTGSAMPYRYYAHPRNAHIGALIEMKYAHVGTTIEVINVSNGRLLQPYTRTLNGIRMPKMNGSAS